MANGGLYSYLTTEWECRGIHMIKLGLHIAYTIMSPDYGRPMK